MSNEYNILRAVVNTLNEVEVKGSANLDRLLGCIQTLESLIASKNSASQEGSNG